MKLLNTYRVFRFISIISFCLPAFNLTQGTDPNKLLSYMRENDYQNAFCRSGTFFKSIRSKSGEDCTGQLGAALALVICKDVGDFNVSQCATKARNTIGSGDKAGALQLKYFEPSEACAFMGNILGDSFLSSCRAKLAGLTYVPPVKPPKPPSPKPEIPPSPKPPEPVQLPPVQLPDVVFWTQADFMNGLKKASPTLQELKNIEGRTGVNLDGKVKLLHASTNKLNFSQFDPVITTTALAKISPEDLNKDDKKAGIVFAKLSPADWKDPVPGEVKFINGLRYQLVTTDSRDNYSILFVSKNFNADFIDTLSIKIPENFNIGELLGKGGKGEVRAVNYKDRKLAIKQKATNEPNAAVRIAYGDYVNSEVQNYEKVLQRIPTAQLSYRGFLGDRIDRWNSKAYGNDIKMLMDRGQNMQSYLKQGNQTSIESNFRPMLSFIAQFHDAGFLHNDIKEFNFIVINGKAQIIDLDNMDAKGKIGPGSGQTSPYYTMGENFSIKADLKALGFAFFAMRYFNDTRLEYQNKFKISPSGEKYLDGNLKPMDIIELLSLSPDKIDTVIINLLGEKYDNAHAALRDL